MSSQPDFSVLMAVYNGERYLASAIQSVLDQTFKNFEIIIIDDGSKDGSLKIMQAFAQKDARIKTISRPNKGLVGTRIELIENAQAEFISWLDQDDLFNPNKLEKQFAYLNQHTECVVLAAEGLLIDEDDDPICTFFQSQPHEKIDEANISGVGSQICFPSVVVRKSILLKVGGIRKDYEYAEDLDTFLRLAEVGKIVILPEVLVSYRQHLESIGYARREKQIKDAQSAINEARSRRGMPQLNFQAMQDQNDYESVTEVYVKWVWWALTERNFKTALKYSWKIIKENPLSFKNYNCLLCVMREVVKYRFP